MCLLRPGGGDRRAGGPAGIARTARPEASHLARLPLRHDGPDRAALRAEGSASHAQTGAADPLRVEPHGHLDDARGGPDPSYWGRHLRQTVRFGDGIAEVMKYPEVNPPRSRTRSGAVHAGTAAARDRRSAARHPQQPRAPRHAVRRGVPPERRRHGLAERRPGQLGGILWRRAPSPRAAADVSVRAAALLDRSAGGRARSRHRRARSRAMSPSGSTLRMGARPALPRPMAVGRSAGWCSPTRARVRGEDGWNAKGTRSGRRWLARILRSASAQFSVRPDERADYQRLMKELRASAGRRTTCCTCGRPRPRRR